MYVCKIPAIGTIVSARLTLTLDKVFIPVRVKNGDRGSFRANGKCYEWCDVTKTLFTTTW